MVQLNELISYVDTLLDVENFHDYAPNGLQVEGGRQVSKLVSGVTASMELLEAAIKHGADTVLVHHGYFWKGENPCVTGMKKRRLECLLKNNINLLAYHLPLDAHPVYGNNAQLGNMFGSSVEGRFASSNKLGMYGTLQKPLSGVVFADHLAKVLDRQPLHIMGNNRPIHRIAWCSGGAQSYFEEAIALGVDAYVSGEISEHTTHMAKECGVHYFAAGHHATERYGVKVLGEHLANKYGIEHTFIDIDNPV
ncbi:MAG: Nif3-like dinuclear metal center hexameric protein [Gammaproteobacteria bacterium]|nr:Nif3-like dinuclear metal center hexameric protein [Gammaproteobacteria bacterium]